MCHPVWNMHITHAHLKVYYNVAAIWLINGILISEHRIIIKCNQSVDRLWMWPGSGKYTNVTH